MQELIDQHAEAMNKGSLIVRSGGMSGFDLMELGIVAAVIAGALAVVVSPVRWAVHLKVMEEQLEDQLEVLSEIHKQLAEVVPENWTVC